MTIDERLDRLAERHEALSQTVEIIAGMQKKNEEQIAQLATFIHDLTRIVKSHEEPLHRLEDGE